MRPLPSIKFREEKSYQLFSILRKFIWKGFQNLNQLGELFWNFNSLVKMFQLDDVSRLQANVVCKYHSQVILFILPNLQIKCSFGAFFAIILICSIKNFILICSLLYFWLVFAGSQVSVAQREDMKFLFNAGNSSFYMLLVFLKPRAFALFKPV